MLCCFESLCAGLALCSDALWCSCRSQPFTSKAVLTSNTAAAYCTEYQALRVDYGDALFYSSSPERAQCFTNNGLSPTPTPASPRHLISTSCHTSLTLWLRNPSFENMSMEAELDREILTKRSYGSKGSGDGVAGADGAGDGAGVGVGLEVM